MKEDTITINSEDDVFRLVAQYAEGHEIPENVTFEGWPNLTFRLTGNKFNKSITPSVMKGFIDMQSHINKAYAAFKYGDQNRRLSKEELDSIELVITIEEGSSIIEINIGGFLESLKKSVLKKMTGKQIAITVISAAFIWGASSSYKYYLDTMREIKLTEISKESEKQTLESIRFMSEQESKRMELLTGVIESIPQLKQQNEIATESKANLLKNLNKADTIEFDDVVLDNELAKELTSTKRKTYAERRIDGIYKVVKVEPGDPAPFKVTVKNVTTGELVSCVVQDVFLDEKENKEIIQQGEWDREPIKLTINAKVLGDEIKSAIIIKAEKIPEKKPEE